MRKASRTLVESMGRWVVGFGGRFGSKKMGSFVWEYLFLALDRDP